MKISRFTDSKIISISKANEKDMLASGLCYEHGMSQATFYKCHKNFDDKVSQNVYKTPRFGGANLA